MQRPAYAIGSVDKALALIKLVAERETVRVTDAAAALGVARSTASRLLDMLAFHGFVAQDERTRAFVAGATLRALGGHNDADDGLRAIARPHIEDVVARLEETVLLTRIDGGAIRVIDSIECRRSLRVTSRTGAIMPTHATAAGKAILATMTRDAIEAHLPSERLASKTPRSLTSRTILMRQLADVRRRGYAVTIGENEPDVRAVAVAIVDADGATRASISLCAPASRLSWRDIPPVASQLHDAARRIGALLGAAP